MTDSPTFDVETALAATIAPRVTEDRIKAVIVGQTFARLTGTLTVCVLTLANGFTVTGESACASPENYDQDIGEYYARKDAERRIWPLEGYLLRDKLALAAAAPIVAGVGMGRFIGTKVINAKPMTRQAYNDLRGWELPADENGADEGMLVEYADGQRPNIDGFQGYVSWSPLDVFASAYAPIGISPSQPVNMDTTEQPGPYAELQPHMQRVAVERDELRERLGKLQSFIGGDTFYALSEVQQADLVDQQSHMCAYLYRLNARLSR